MSDCRYVVADRNRRDYDFAAAGRDADRSRNGDATVSRHFELTFMTKAEKAVGDERRRLSGHHETVSFDAADDLGRRRALQKNNTGRKFRAFISRATARGATNTVISGLWAR
jgi:hypothetical protein